MAEGAEPGHGSLIPTAGEASDAFDRFERAGAHAAAAAGGPFVTRIALPGIVVDIEFSSARLREQMGPPFAHLLTEAGPPGLRITAWESEESGVPLPEGLPSPGSVYLQSLPALRDDGRTLWAFHRPDPGLTAFDAAHSRAVYWVPDSGALTFGDIAGGFRAIFAWAMAARGLRFLHSAAVAWRGRAALIAGPSGSGKSSTALSCLAAGLDYLGDDHCLLDLREGPTVHSVYAAAKLHTAQMERFPEFAPYVVNPMRTEGEKAVAILMPAFSDRLPRRAPIAAVLAPRVSGAATTTFERLPAGGGLAALAPSTLLQMAAADRGSLAAMAELVRRVPCYRVNLGTDKAEVAEAVRAFLEREGAP